MRATQRDQFLDFFPSHVLVELLGPIGQPLLAGHLHAVMPRRGAGIKPHFATPPRNPHHPCSPLGLIVFTLADFQTFTAA
jgi:hypothetical protein